MSKFPSKVTKRSCDRWDFPFKHDIENSRNMQKNLFFSPPIAVVEGEQQDKETKKRRRQLKVKSINQLQQEYKEFVRVYQKEVDKYHNLESQREKIQQEIEELQEEIKVLTVENQQVEEEYRRLKPQ
ncbi:hypothetical protein TVAG_224570 [Trichomonas vaginalis G3]|uniref:Uncharacterized protein n=1 Tax=Trichomonas vaginalis (strain ATCC PRA-98 / G3) TaxID=412133 RepID=A2DW80_TRIV3|nr:hypothetical protein TVAGG3_0804320 [Trichomonas vaginalis G3]EAY15381.1 hypothetical protein TVAG_224570 [Trichomonas vaginalis G3]KAI5496744.1 hypothetical protein TVAGG3_0804320 [Trichomonas vaginalis G3]|eukprot:XP_001327604.1 hypothetical protein [Trichomonas vaginalis G3]